MKLTRVNAALAPRPGAAPAMWTAAAPSSFFITEAPGWLDEPLPVYAWQPPAGASKRLSTPLSGLVVGDRYCWLLTIGAVQPVTVSVMGQQVALPTSGYRFVTGSFVATGSDTFTIDTVAPCPAGAVLFVATLLVEERHTGASGRHFDGSMPGADWTGVPWQSTSTFVCDADPATLEPSSSYPMVVVEADAQPPQPWEFVLDQSSLDDPAALLTDSPRWTQLRTVTSVTITRGRTDENQQVQAGTLQILADGYDGQLDPNNPASVYRPNGSQSYFAKGTLIRVVSLGIASALQFDASALFTGRIEDWEVDAAWSMQVTGSAVDDLAVVGTTSIPPYTTPVRVGETTGGRVAWVANTAGVACEISPMATRVLTGISGGGSARALVDDAATAEGGRGFVDVHNVLQLTVHADEYTKVPAVTITDSVTAGSTRANVDYEAVTASSGVAAIINQVTVDRGQNAVGDQTVSAADLASVAVHGVSSVTVSASLADEAEAEDLADYLATRRSQPSERVSAMTVNLAGQEPVWAQQCVRMDLGTQVEVIRHIAYTTGSRVLDQLMAVEGVAHRITPDGWTVDFALAPADATALFGGAGAFVLDVSSLDGPDVLTPY